MREKLKKSETLEIRIPYPTKQAFMARCRDEGRSASETLRDLIEGRLAPPPRPARWRRMAVGALIAAAMGAVAAPSLARPPAGFDRLDRDHDGRITAADLAAFDANHDGAVSRTELDAR